MKETIVNTILRALFFLAVIAFISIGPSWLVSLKHSLILIFLSVFITDMFAAFSLKKDIIALVASRFLLVLSIAFWAGAAYWLGSSLGRAVGFLPALEQGNFYPLFPENLKQAFCSWPAFFAGNITWLVSEVIWTYYRDETELEKIIRLMEEEEVLHETTS